MALKRWFLFEWQRSRWFRINGVLSRRLGDIRSLLLRRGGERQQVVDKKLGHPGKFSGEDKDWPDSSFDFLGYVGSLSGQLVGLMNDAALSDAGRLGLSNGRRKKVG